MRVQNTKHTTVSYYKQASRAGEGFGNRSSSRFHTETTSFVGPGKYSPAMGAQSNVDKDKGHSGKLKSTAPRFLKKVTSEAQHHAAIDEATLVLVLYEAPTDRMIRRISR